jgi:hypothetical protein
MNRKKFTLLTAIASTSLMAFAAIALASSNVNLFSARGQGEVVDGSVTWNTSSSKTGKSNRISYTSSTARGTQIVLYSYGQWNPNSNYIFTSKKSESLDYGIFISNEVGSASSLYQFQSITSVSITTAASSQNGSSFAVYTDATVSGSPVKVQEVSASETTYTISTEVAGAHYLAIKPNNTVYSVDIKSVTVNYSCEPGGGEPVVDEYSISYIGMDGEYNPIPLEGIDESSLVTKAEEGSSVQITPVVLSGYQYLSSFEFTDYIEDYVENAGVISFTMPSNNITLCLVTQSTAVELSSISITGTYETEFTVGDTFSFGGTVTAHYSNSTSADVTASATFAGYDMSTAGNQTVTVSYTEAGVTKTASYGITVSNDTPEPSEVTLSGKYEYASRTKSGYGYSNWPNMYIEFTSDGKALWHNDRVNGSTTYYCDLYFVYMAANDGANINIEMSIDSERTPHHTGYYGYWFTKVVNGGDIQENNSSSGWSGGGYDRPVDSAFTSQFKNNSGVMNIGQTSLTINVYDYSHSYEVYDTFTFTLVS